jgi:hypothetical protein
MDIGHIISFFAERWAGWMDGSFGSAAEILGGGKGLILSFFLSRFHISFPTTSST